ncbi:MAG: apolipoprotein N-acyltransferase [Frankiaceae bacterium]|nr:apolipoprotein N-acyltransferase [Frankiaceae bacterium]
MARTLLRAASALLSGIAIWTSFPPLRWWPVAILGVAALTLSLRSAPSWKSAAGAGYLAGIGFWIPLMSFLRGGFGFAAWGAVAAFESLWFLLLALALRPVLRLRWWPLATALLWIGEEFLRDRLPFGGFPWGRLAFGQANGPLLHLASLGGAPLVGFGVALAGGLLAYAAASKRPSMRTFVALDVVALVVAGPLLISLPTAGTTRGGAPASAVVAAIQGNVPRLGLEAFAQKRAVTANHLAETEQLAAAVAEQRAPAPDFVVWPENSDDLDPRTDVVSHVAINQASAAIGVPILIGAVIDADSTHVQNAGIVWSPTAGPGQMYLKRHLVPFGEYLPFRGLMTAISGRFNLIAKDFLPGHRAGTLSIAGIPVADTICFEVADDAVVRQAVTGGGRLLVVQTNNASYEQPGDSGNGGETAQQLAIAQLRAVEHGRAVVVAATSGVSAMIAPNGSILARTAVFQPAMLDRRMPLRDPRTIADRVGPWPEWLLSTAAGLVLALAYRRRRSLTRADALDLNSTVTVTQSV